MKKPFVSTVLAIALLTIALAATGTVPTDTSIEVNASEQTLAEPLEFPWQPFWLTETTPEMSTSVYTPSTSWVCNQGAYCTYRNDPACGPEGFCNLPSNCCMCY